MKSFKHPISKRYLLIIFLIAFSALSVILIILSLFDGNLNVLYKTIPVSQKINPSQSTLIFQNQKQNNTDLPSFTSALTNAIVASDFMTIVSNQHIDSVSCPNEGVCQGMNPGQTITGYVVAPAYSEFRRLSKDNYVSFLKQYFATNSPLVRYYPKTNNSTKIIYYNNTNNRFILFSLQQYTNTWQIAYTLYGQTDSLHPVDTVSLL